MKKPEDILKLSDYVEIFRKEKYDKSRLVVLANCFDYMHRYRKDNEFNDLFMQRYIGFISDLIDAAHGHWQEIPDRWNDRYEVSKDMI